MRHHQQIIDVSAIELDPPVMPKRRSRLLALPFVFIPVLLTAGGAFGLWSGDMTMYCLLGFALLGLVIGLNLTHRRISGIAGITLLAGLSGLLLAFANFSVWTSLLGLAVTGMAILVQKKIEQRGWNFEN